MRGGTQRKLVPETTYELHTFVGYLFVLTVVETVLLFWEKSLFDATCHAFNRVRAAIPQTSQYCPLEFAIHSLYNIVFFIFVGTNFSLYYSLVS